MGAERALVVLLLTTRDEADVLELNLEHHLGWGFDHVGVCDNRSRDNTQDVLDSFGDRVTSLVFDDFARRQSCRMRCLDSIAARYGRRPDWIAVADSDELFWSSEKSLRGLLADVPRDVVAATSRQKLFVPTENDPPSGPVYSRLLYRTASHDSPFHHSYREGKTFYRGTWLRKLTSEHRCPEVPHPEWVFPTALVHHYMIRDADQFVSKVSRLHAWRPHSRLRGSLFFDRAYRILMGRRQAPFVAGFKLEWWRVLQEGGEAALRAYYRDCVQVSRARLGAALEAGDLVRDDALAKSKARSART